jgi:hypothetical protein
MRYERTPNCATCGRPRERAALVVRSCDDLKRLRGLRQRYEAIRFALPGLTENANRILEDEVQRNYLECGCKAGGYAMGFCVVLGCVLFIRAWYRTGGVPWDFLPWWFGLVLVGSLAAKAAAILRARWRLARRMRQLVEASSDHQRSLGSGLALGSQPRV